MAAACVFPMSLPDADYRALLGSDDAVTGRFEPPLINIGVGSDVTIHELASTVQAAVGFEGKLAFDSTKPDGTPRKLMDVAVLAGQGWSARMNLADGITQAYRDYLGGTKT